MCTSPFTYKQDIKTCSTGYKVTKDHHMHNHTCILITRRLASITHHTDATLYGNCPKILFTYFSHKHYTNSADPDQTALEEQSDLGLHCLPFYKVFCEQIHWRTKFRQKEVWYEVLKILGHLPKFLFFR